MGEIPGMEANILTPERKDREATGRDANMLTPEQLSPFVDEEYS